MEKPFYTERESTGRNMPHTLFMVKERYVTLVGSSKISKEALMYKKPKVKKHDQLTQVTFSSH